MFAFMSNKALKSPINKANEDLSDSGAPQAAFVLTEGGTNTWD